MTAATRAACHALVPCAGSGARAGLGGPKQYADVAGKSVVAHTLVALRGVQRLASITVVLASDDVEFERVVDAVDRERVIAERCGGETRAGTVANGLDALLARGVAREDWVLVHDAARCLIRAAWVDRLIDACVGDGVGGLLAWPVADTLKVEREGRVQATLDRRATWQAQTPQMFRIGPLRDALAAAGAAVTDEASAIEASGQQPLLVTGALENFKLTYPADFALAERLLRTREETT